MPQNQTAQPESNDILSPPKPQVSRLSDFELSLPQGNTNVRRLSAYDGPMADTVDRIKKNLFVDMARNISETPKEAAKGVARGVESGILGGIGSLTDWLGQNISEYKSFDTIAYEEAVKVVKEKGGSKKDVERLTVGLNPYNRLEKNIQNIGKEISKLGKDSSRFWAKAAQEGIEAPDPELFQGTFMQNPSFARATALVAEAVPSLGAATAITFVSKNPYAGALMLGTLQGSTQFQEAREKGKTVKEANVIGAVSSVVNTILEKIPLERFLKSKGTLAKNIMAGITIEGTQEGLQQIWTNAVAKYGYDDTRDLREGLVESIIAGAGSGGVMGGLTSGHGSRVDKAIEKAKSKGMTDTEIQTMQAAIATEIIDNSKVINKVLNDHAKDNIVRNPDGTPMEINTPADLEYQEIANPVLRSAKYKDQVLGTLANAKKEALDEGNGQKLSRINRMIQKNQLTPQEIEALEVEKIKVPTPEEMMANRKVSLTDQAINFGVENQENKILAKKALDEAEKNTKERIKQIKAIPEDQRTDAQDQEAYTLGGLVQFYHEAAEALEGKLTKESARKGIDKAKNIGKTPADIEMAYAGAMKEGTAKTSKVKTQIRQATGQVKDQGGQISERAAFIQNLKDRVKAAAESRTATREEVFDIQNAVVDMVNNSDLEADDKAKFIKTVKNIQTEEQFQKALPDISEKIIQLEAADVRRGLISDIKKTVKSAKESNSIAIDFVNTIDALMEDFDLQNRRPETLLSLNKSAEYFKEQIALGNEVEIPKALLKKMQILEKTPLENLTNEDLQSLLSDVTKLAEQGETKLRVAQNINANKQQRDLAALKADSRQISPKEINRPGIGERLSYVENVQNQIKEGANLVQEKGLALAPMDVVFDLLDGVKNFAGSNYKIFKANVDAKWSQFLTKRQKLIDPIIKMTKDLKLDDKNFERIGVHAAREQEGGRKKLIDTGLTEQEIDAIKLDENELKLYNAMREVFDSMAPAIEEVMRVTYNKPFERVKNYFSFMTDFEAMSDSDIRERFGNSVEEFGKAPRKNVQKGFTLSRVLGKQKIKLNAMEVFLRHTENATYLTELGPTIKYLGDLASTEEYKESVGELGQEIVRDWVDLLARKGGTAGDKILLFDILRKNVGLATLGFKLSSALIQPTSLLNGASLIGGKAFEGAKDIASSKQWRQFVMTNFPEIKARVGDDPAFLEFGGNTVIDKTARASMWALQNLDLLAASSVAAGAYSKIVQAKGGQVDFANPDREAIQEAQRIVRRTQSSSFFKDAPSVITRGKLTGNVSLDKTIFQFQSFVLNEFSMIQHELVRQGIVKGNYAQAANITVWLILAQLAQIGLRRVSKELIAFMTGEELEDWPETFTKEFIGGMIDKIPFVSQIASAVQYGSIPVPAVDMASKIAKRFSAAVNAKSDDAKARNFVRGIILTLGGLAGIPGTVQAEQIIKSQLTTNKTKKIK